MLDIRSDSKNIVAARLSNFTERKFDFEGVHCSSIEAALQAFKSSDQRVQEFLCERNAKEANQAGQELNSWKKDQVLWWRGQDYMRDSVAYQMLLGRLYDTAYEQDPLFRTDLLRLRDEEICHSIGKSDPTDTVLTEEEMISQLERLRVLANR